MLNKEKINFNLPIYFTGNKTPLTNEIKKDLELIETDDLKQKPIYNILFNSNTYFDNLLLDKWGEYTCNNKLFLKDSQHLYKNINDLQNNQLKIDKMIKIWNNINNETNFLEKYQFIEWEKLYFLNNSKLFLSILSFYNFTSPVIQLLSPLFALITPFLIMKSLGIPITSETYYNILIQNLKLQPIFQLFISFNAMNLGQQIYGLLMLGLYIYNIYSNIISCYKFYIQMKTITEEFDDIKKYLDYTIENITFILNKTKHLKSYHNFNIELTNKKNKLIDFLNNIRCIPKTIFKGFNITHIGSIMKYYFTLWDSKDIEELIHYSFGFNCYYNNLIGLNKNIQDNKINYCKFSNNSNKFTMKDNYHPTINDNVVKNNICLKKSKIITGPNASGKTTLIKSITINTIISQQIGLGFYSKFKFKPYDLFHCYINIPDTNNRDSLFQSEARRCKNILDLIDGNKNKTHFCIFDELYSGTNPYEAIATAYSYLDYISKNKNVKFILTTHYIKLCEMLNSDKYIENIHMKTDIINDKPKYHYKIQKGISVIKGGVHVLKDLNYPDSITNSAFEVLKRI
jgi:hypothetical protein